MAAVLLEARETSEMCGSITTDVPLVGGEKEGADVFSETHGKLAAGALPRIDVSSEIKTLWGAARLLGDGVP